MGDGDSRGAGLRVGDHACWLYSDEDERRSVLAAYFADGVAAGERLAYYGQRGTERQVLDYLAGDHDVDALVARGQLLFGVAEDVYAPGGVFDPDARVRAYEQLVVESVAAGYPGLRVFGDAGWVGELLDDPGPWHEYELRADLLASRLPFVALCGYDARRAAGGLYRLADAVHRGALADRPSAFHLHGRPDRAVALSGEVDFAVADRVRGLLAAIARDGAPPAIDLSGLSFIDAAGATAVFRAARSLGDVPLVEAPTIFRRVWDVLGYDAALPVCTRQAG